MARVGAWFCFALLALLMAGGAVWLSSLGLPSRAVAQGVTIAGVALVERDVEAVVQELTRRVEATPILLSSASSVVDGISAHSPATLGEVGVSVDPHATLRRARSIGRRGSPLARARELDMARSRGLDVPLELTLDRDALFQALASVKQRRDQAPVPARYPSAGAALVPHVPGRYLDLERTADAVWSAAQTRATQLAARVAMPVSGEPSDDEASAAEPPLQVPWVEVSVTPRVNADVLQHFQPHKVIGRYSTRFRLKGDQATRAANIAVAASRLDGLILLPGDRISFNDVVGERSVENGFHDSWELMEGEFVRGVGGGTCQVSSTLNAAALHAGLQIVEAYTHSRPLAYIEKGLDATVAWPFVDLKLRNSWPTPLVIQAVVDGNMLTVRLLAEASPGRVSIRSEIKETYPFPREVEVGRVARKSFKLKQAGIPGFRIERTRIIRPDGGEARREVVYKRYRPTPELFLVAPDFDTSELPPLPEGAEGYDPALDPTEDAEAAPNGVDELFRRAPGVG